MKDARFSQAFGNKKVKFRRPEGEDWFNILVIHQTKERSGTADLSRHSFIKEHVFPLFIDLILWGHEHECVPLARKCEVTGTYILYMGSTTVTSLIDAEAKPKHCFVLTVDKTRFEIMPIALKRARPLVYDQIELSRCRASKDDKGIEECIESKVWTMVKGAKGILPLVRLKVEYTGYHVVAMSKLEKKMEGKIANCRKDFVKFYRRPQTSRRRVSDQSTEDASMRNIEDPDKAELDLIVLSFTLL
eukprot:TRINITY_DN11136_c0_g1_i13.p2 TRINITY_DN11136_c0_g1~~TRINITY_DN11136_c0_g1_i13.p2  ORF type:complete len:246 (-),score=76.47 TRINITY_DN11136_c0_g1_i13:552-1289(-)